MGGYLAAAYALQHPEHVAQLILVSPVGVPRKPADWDERMQNRFAPARYPRRLSCRRASLLQWLHVENARFFVESWLHSSR
jgi:pimeloyl-ACP methyl ester carboxylesterase